MIKISTLILLLITVVLSTPIKYCYNGKISDYSSYEANSNGPLDISLEILSNEEIRTYEIPDPTLNKTYYLNYEVTLQHLTIGSTDLISTSITGQAQLKYSNSSIQYDLRFYQNDVNLVLLWEKEKCITVNPISCFEVYYSTEYFKLTKDADFKGGVYFNSSEEVPEPSRNSLFLLSILFILVIQFKYLRKIKSIKYS